MKGEIQLSKDIINNHITKNEVKEAIQYLIEKGQEVGNEKLLKNLSMLMGRYTSISKNIIKI